MSENSKPIPQNEEVDLGQLFKMIGNAFQKFFDFVGSIFKGLFGLLILIIAHFYKRAKFYAIAIIAGLVIGYFLDSTSVPTYKANMFLKTNFESGYQVYENIDNLNQLASSSRDSVKLSELLGISVSEAAQIQGFSIQPSIDPNESMLMFSNYKKGLDSLAREEVNYKTYIESLSGYNFTTQKISMSTLSRNIPDIINSKLPVVVSENDYLKRILEVNQNNFDKEDNVLAQQTKEIDSLVKKYLEIRIKESNRESSLPGSGTNLFMGDAQKSNLIVNEVDLLNEKLKIEGLRRRVQLEKAIQNDIVSVIASFPKTGSVENVWYKNYIFISIISLFIIVCVTFIFIGIGKYLKKEGAI